MSQREVGDGLGAVLLGECGDDPRGELGLVGSEHLAVGGSEAEHDDCEHDQLRGGPGKVQRSTTATSARTAMSERHMAAACWSRKSILVHLMVWSMV